MSGKSVFRLKGSENNPVTEFEVKIDLDGDLVIKANGLILLHIDASSGKIHRFSLGSSQQATTGLKFDTEGRIEEIA